jgi:23S rRNA (guanosine2251-2'-O)-methyltransferase
MARQIYILLHDIRSVYNVGAIFRTADAVGVTKIYLTGYTPTPVDRFNQPRQDFAKCALGSEKTVVWEYVKSPTALITRLKKEGIQIISIEQNETSIDYKKVKPAQKTLVVLGNEVTGVSKSILKKSDIIAEIPMRGMKESLNVSVSAGIVLFRLFDKA